MPAALGAQWDDLQKGLLAKNEDWQVWTKWYEARLRGDALNKNLELARVTTLTEEDWELGKTDAGHVNEKIRDIIESFEPPGTPDDAPPAKIEPQTQGALRFIADAQGRIDVDLAANAEALLNDQNAQDRHSEVIRIGGKFEKQVAKQSFGQGADQTLLEDIQLLLDAVGATINAGRPGLIIPRGEALRILAEHNKTRDGNSDLPPLPDDIALGLDEIVRAYNVYVGLDPVLSRADEARFGPDAIKNMVPRDQGVALAKDAVEKGVATAQALAAVEEEAANLPDEPDENNRNVRRFSEDNKNLYRAALAEVDGYIEWLKRNPIAASIGIATTGGTLGPSAGKGVMKIGEWVVKNSEALMQSFSHSPTMIEIIERIIAAFI